MRSRINIGSALRCVSVRTPRGSGYTTAALLASSISCKPKTRLRRTDPTSGLRKMIMRGQRANFRGRCRIRFAVRAIPPDCIEILTAAAFIASGQAASEASSSNTKQALPRRDDKISIPLFDTLIAGPTWRAQALKSRRKQSSFYAIHAGASKSWPINGVEANSQTNASTKKIGFVAAIAWTPTKGRSDHRGSAQSGTEMWCQQVMQAVEVWLYSAKSLHPDGRS